MHLSKTRSIGKRIIFGLFSAIIFMMITVAGFTVFSTHYSKLYNDMLDSIIKANQINSTMKEYTLSLVKQIGFDRANMYNKSVDTRQDVFSNLSFIQKVIPEKNTEGKHHYESISSMVDTYFSSIKEISDHYETIPISEVTIKYEGLRKLGDFIENAVNHFVNSQLTYYAQMKISINQKFSLVLVCMLGATFFIIFFTAAYSFRLSSNITKGLRKLTETSRKIAEGNLNVDDLKIKTNDELEFLAGAFNEMKWSLKDITEKTYRVGKSLASAAFQMESNISETFEATRQLSLSVQTIAEGADKQAIETDYTFRAIENIHKVMELSSNSLETVIELSDHSKRSAETSIASINHYIDQIIIVSQVMDTAVASVSVLNEKASRIGKITGAITNIAEQTNLLALNATIEAARAGKAGEGFNVIAEEVKKLSEQSTGSAKEITYIVTDIQNEIRNITAHIFKAVKQVKETACLVTSTKTALNNIGEGSKVVNSEIRIAASRMEEILQNIITIKEGSQTISHIAQIYASNCQEAAASTEEQYSVQDQMKALSMLLVNEAEKLDVLLNRFQFTKII